MTYLLAWEHASANDNASTPLVQFANLKQISANDGLSDNSVQKIYQDTKGLLWFATELGLNGYDSHRVFHLGEERSSLFQQSVTNISQDSLENYWVSTENGLYIFDSNLVEIQTPRFPSPINQQENANRVIGSVEITPGTSWVLTWNGIYQYTINNKEIYQPKAMKLFQRSQLNILSYYKDDLGIWLGTSQGIYFYNTEKNKLTKISVNQLSKPTKILKLIKNSDRSLFFSDNAGLYEVDIRNFNPLSENNISLDAILVFKGSVSDFISMDSNNKEVNLFSTDDSIYSYNRKNKQTSFLFSLNDALPNNSYYRIKTLFLDQQRLLWIGTKSKGTYQWDTRSLNFKLFSSQSKDTTRKLNGNEVWSIELNNQNNYWVGSNKGLNLINSKSLESTSVIDNQSFNLNEKQLKIYDTYEIENHLWMATANDLSQLDILRKKITHFRPQWTTKNDKFIVFTITSTDENSLWLGTNIGLLNFDINTKKFRYSPFIQANQNKKMTRFVKNINGLLLIGTSSELMVYSPSNNITKVILKTKQDTNGSPFELTDVVYVNNKIWASYIGDGIYVVENSIVNKLLSNNNSSDKKKVIHLNKSTNIPDSSIYSLELNSGFIWATTNTGLVRIDPLSLIFSVFDSSFGLPVDEFNEGASLQASNLLIYGGPNGLTMIKPSALAQLNQNVSAPQITKISSIQNNQLTMDISSKKKFENLELPTNTLLYIDFTMLDFRNPNSWEFKYWLDTENLQTKRKTKQAKILLANLSPGRHILYIQARSKYYLKDSDIARLHINVKTSFLNDTKTSILWFLFFASLSILSILFLVRKNERSKTKLRSFELKHQMLKSSLIDSNRGIWELTILPDDSAQITVFQESTAPMTLSIERYFDFVHTDFQEHVKSSWLSFLTGEVSKVSEKYKVYFHGVLVWNYIQGKAVSYDKQGKPKMFIGIWVNIDEDKKLEERLNLYSHAFQSTQDIVFILDNELSIIAVNRTYEISTGYSCDFLVGRSMIEIAFSRFTAIETNEIKEFVIRNKHWHGQSSVPRRNASSFAVDIRINIISKDERDSGYVVVMSDISDVHRSTSNQVDNRFYDQSTGLPNKVMAFDHLRKLIQNKNNVQPNNLSLALLQVKLQENHKQVLDDFFQVLTARLAPYISRNDIFARYDECHFIFILQQKQGDEETIGTINHLISESLKPIDLNGENYHANVHAGISRYPSDSDNWSDLLSKAQLALEKSFKQKKVLFSYFQESRNQHAVELIDLENRLTKAIENHEFYLVFQPIVNIEKKVILHAEVSFRWLFSKERIIYPAQIIPLALELEIIEKVNQWFIANALSNLHRWNQEGLFISLVLPLSKDFFYSEHCIQYFTQSLLDNDINPADITLSIQEDCLSDKNRKLESTFSQLKELGISIMIAEFGKKNASLHNLNNFNVSMVSIDKSIVREVGINRKGEIVLSSILHLVEKLEMCSVANGIENEIQEDFLLQERCQLGQGFRYSDPLMENQMRQILLKKQN